MTYELHLALFACLGVLGFCTVISTFLRSRPALRQALERLTPAAGPVPIAWDTGSIKARVGTLAYPYLARWQWFRLPEHDLRLLEIDPARFLGDKILSGAAGFALPLVLTVSGRAIGAGIPESLALAAAPILGAALFLAPDAELRAKAARARTEFAQHLQIYLDLVTLNRIGGVGALQSLERAAAVGDSWVFHRLTEVLQRSQLAGQPPWLALSELSRRLALPDLADLGDIMTMSGEWGTSVVDSLRARSRSQRHEIVTHELGAAEAASERLRIPAACIALLLVAMLTVPSVVNIMNP
ncbi:hypothetical protein [Nocardia terpenica]|uniref:Type II secretion system protein GspF domain-containing protein n=1 Tax=Nocardia terpenica TaxID=455432 RepID=A0A6G9ZCE2_9NOCA|nr:hypothetical protein [Nocardia terpenica]QIS22816.1 hypothetical protein F6W96_35250 [Nocardia terpenica]